MAPDYQSGMAQPELQPGMKIVLEAVSPVDGLILNTVTISQVVISGIKIAAGESQQIEVGPWFLVAGET